MEKKIIQTNAAPVPIGPYNQAVQYGDLIFISGQIPLDTASGKIINSGIADETKKVMENIGAILKAAEMDFSNIIKSSIFIMDMDQFGIINEIYGSYFTDNFPARETIQVAGLPKGVNIEISVIAAK